VIKKDATKSMEIVLASARILAFGEKNAINNALEIATH
jgi:hypothetical protein